MNDQLEMFPSEEVPVRAFVATEFEVGLGLLNGLEVIGVAFAGADIETDEVDERVYLVAAEDALRIAEQIINVAKNTTKEGN